MEEKGWDKSAHMSPGGALVKNLPASAGDAGDTGLIPGSEDPLK